MHRSSGRRGEKLGERLSWEHFQTTAVGTVDQLPVVSCINFPGAQVGDCAFDQIGQLPLHAPREVIWIEVRKGRGIAIETDF